MTKRTLDELLNEANSNLGSAIEDAKLTSKFEQVEAAHERYSQVTEAYKFLMSINKDLRAAGEHISPIVNKTVQTIGEYFGASCSIWLQYDEDSSRFNFNGENKDVPESILSMAEELRIQSYHQQAIVQGSKETADGNEDAYYIAPLTVEDKEGKTKQGILQIVKENGQFSDIEKIVLKELTRTATLAIKSHYDEIDSKTDPLTGAYNRRLLLSRYDTEVINANDYGTPFSVLLMDIDKFKRINDNYGHIQGDNVLIQLADLIKNNLKGRDTFARWGGEEFMVLLPKTNENEAYLFAESLRSLVESYQFKMGTENNVDFPEKVTISIGVASYNNMKREQDLTDIADKKLYMAKETGRNRVM